MKLFTKVITALFFLCALAFVVLVGVPKPSECPIGDWLCAKAILLLVFIDWCISNWNVILKPFFTKQKD